LTLVVQGQGFCCARPSLFLSLKKRLCVSSISRPDVVREPSKFRRRFSRSIDTKAVRDKDSLTQGAAHALSTTLGLEARDLGMCSCSSRRMGHIPRWQEEDKT
jgi:hypothetical protein